MYYGPGIVDVLVGNGRMLLDKCRLETSCAFTRWQHFSAQNDLIAAIFKAWVKSKIKLLSIDVHLLKEQSCQISSRSDLKQWGL